MRQNNIFNNLFVFDLANNHQGDVDHGKLIINDLASKIKKHKVKGAIKFQFRQLDTFVHPDHLSNSDNKHIPRFLSTRLDKSDYSDLLSTVREKKLIAMTTPFDEESVDIAIELDFDILKIASCSAKDWPLIEKIASAGKPVIFSTGGLTMTDIDNLVSFFQHRGVDFAIMHCISIYPTPNNMCQLNQISELKDRFPAITIGWSTHEDQDEVAPIHIAYAKGARIFERHVGMQTDEIKLNAYSSTSDQIDKWLSAHSTAVDLCGSDVRPISQKIELDAIDTLQRGVYARNKIKKGNIIKRNQVYFSMPYISGQLYSGDWKEGITALNNVEPDKAITYKNTKVPVTPEYQIIKNAIHEVKGILNKAKITLGTDFKVEYSHHYGVKKFNETGCVLIDCVNREYCKKLIVQLPKQSHPLHFHERKEETFQVLHGELYLELDGRVKKMQPGDSALVMPGVWHRFWTDTGAIVEEISTTHFNNDSFYKDPLIQNKKREDRKTVVEHWGRYELNDYLASG